MKEGPGEKAFEEKVNDIDLLPDLAVEAKDFSLNFSRSSSVIDVAALSLFNLLKYERQHVDAIDQLKISKWEDEVSSLESEERWAADPANPLPTIGVELEVPRALAKQHYLEVLRTLNIDNNEDPDVSAGWREMRSQPSYSAHTQAAFLHELYNILGTEKIKEIANNTRKLGRKMQVERDFFSHAVGTEFLPINGKFSTSLHVNFGVPSWTRFATRSMNDFPQALSRTKATYTMEQDSDLHRLSGMIMLAFTSPNRLATRKTEALILGKDDATITTKNMDLRLQEDYPALRLEIRTPEFRDSSTYRLLIELQYLISAYFCKNSKTEARDPLKEQLANLWDSFVSDTRTFFKQFNMSNVTDFEHYDTLFSEIITTQPDAIAEARRIMSHFSREIKSVIEQAFPTQ